MDIKQPSTPPTRSVPAPSSPAAPKAPPEVQVAPSYDFTPGAGSKAALFRDSLSTTLQPGEWLNMVSGKRFREVRAELEPPTPYTGVKKNEDGTATATDVPNPDSPDGRWDPHAYMPRFVFDKREDAFPVSPTFDGDLDHNNNGPETSNGPGGSYRDGVVGGDQALSGGFAVTKKGDYTILTYSFYYATNKAGQYHKNDYSTAQVYLKPGEDGKLKPEYLATSWHHGAQLTKWADLPKDEHGDPIVGVDLGAHALRVADEVPKEGFSLRGDGEATVDGLPIDQRITFDAFQKNVQGANYLDPKSEAAKPRLNAMTWGELPFNPFLPEVYEQQPEAWQQLLSRGWSGAKGAAEKVYDKAEDTANDVVDKAGGLLEDAGGVAKSGLSKARDFFSGL